MAFIEINKSDSDKLNHTHSSSLMNDVVICNAPDKLKKLIEKICPGTSTHYVSDGYWNTHDLVLEIIKKFKEPCELYISTYAIREMPIRKLILAMDSGEISGVKLLLDYRAKVRTPEVFQLANMNMSEIYLTRVHAKVCVLKFKSHSVAIVGSSNWTTNPKIESGVVTVDSDVSNFHINWITQIMQDAEIFK